jgi:hypothetical protein
MGTSGVKARTVLAHSPSTPSAWCGRGCCESLQNIQCRAWPRETETCWRWRGEATVCAHSMIDLVNFRDSAARPHLPPISALLSLTLPHTVHHFKVPTVSTHETHPESSLPCYFKASQYPKSTNGNKASMFTGHDVKDIFALFPPQDTSHSVPRLALSSNGHGLITFQSVQAHFRSRVTKGECSSSLLATFAKPYIRDAADTNICTWERPRRRTWACSSTSS